MTPPKTVKAVGDRASRLEQRTLAQANRDSSIAKFFDELTKVAARAVTLLDMMIEEEKK